MKLIKPAEISAKIMTLIDEAEKELIVVSPYNNITGWEKFINRIKKAQSQGVEISWYTRKNNVEKNNSEEVRSLGIEPVLVDNLHAKIYMNEAHAIVTSMNMSKISDVKSIDIGYITESRKEYDELYNTFLKHIKSKPSPTKIKANPKINESDSNNKYLQINTKQYFVKVIHEHIYRTYGAFEYRYKKDEVLEYIEFLNPGYKIQFIPYSRAIKLLICIPPILPIKHVEQLVFNDFSVHQLVRNNEIECYETESEQFVKFYFKLPYRKIDEWENSELERFLHYCDVLIQIVFPSS